MSSEPNSANSRKGHEAVSDVMVVYDYTSG